MTSPKDTRQSFHCVCGMIGHQFVVEAGSKDEELGLDPYVCVYVQLTPGSFFERLKSSFQYLFQLKAPTCHYADVLLEEKDVERLIKLLQEHQKLFI